MNRVLRGISAGVAAVCISMLATGCAGGGGSQTSDALATNPSEISGDITFSTWWAYANQDLIDGFAKQYPNVQVKLSFTAIGDYATKLQADASAGSLPDVFAVQGPSLVELAGADQLYDLNESLKTPAYDGQGVWGETFNQSLMSGANAGTERPENQSWGVPFNAISVASIYNTRIFDKVGVTPPKTFDELLGNCKALSAAGYIPMSLTGTAWMDWWPRLAWDQTLRDEEVANFSVSNPQYIKGLERVKQMADAGCWSKSQIGTDIAAETALFLQERTAQFVSVPENFLQAVANGAQFDLGTYTLPALDGKTPNRVLGGGNANVLAVSAKSENKSAAVAFAKYLTSADVQTKLAETQFTIPSLDIDLSSANPLMKAYVDAANGGFIDSSTYMPAFSTAGNRTFTTEVLPRLIFDDLSPEKAAAATEGLFNK
ncbi:ABC transporter substrate-binding protein [Pseudarthrobacter sp. 1C304]|uniref:ABC transporter substrate-binding protein n=1 Tax=Pseudarthrobacter sp. 1C304 TaxID=3457438 RepID=UPI003FD56868